VEGEGRKSNYEQHCDERTARSAAQPQGHGIDLLGSVAHATHWLPARRNPIRCPLSARAESRAHREPIGTRFLDVDAVLMVPGFIRALSWRVGGLS
jgi:hypothetical protein